MQEKLLLRIIEVLKNENLESIKYEENNLKIEVKQFSNLTTNNTVQTNSTTQDLVKTSVENKIEEPTNVITTPLTGIVYYQPNPTSPSFIKVGDKIQKGDILFIVEAMKVMNNITANKEGIVKNILVPNGELVSTNQAIIELE